MFDSGHLLFFVLMMPNSTCLNDKIVNGYNFDQPESWPIIVMYDCIVSSIIEFWTSISRFYFVVSMKPKHFLGDPKHPYSSAVFSTAFSYFVIFFLHVSNLTINWWNCMAKLLNWHYVPIVCILKNFSTWGTVCLTKLLFNVYKRDCLLWETRLLVMITLLSHILILIGYFPGLSFPPHIILLVSLVPSPSNVHERACTFLGSNGFFWAVVNFYFLSTHRNKDKILYITWTLIALPF